MFGTGWADSMWREIIFSQVGVASGVLKEDPEAVQGNRAGVSNMSLCLIDAIVLPRLSPSIVS